MRRMIVLKLLSLYLVCAVISSDRAEGQAPSEGSTQAEPALDRAPGLKIALEGHVQSYLHAVTRNWLCAAPEANPAMLAMFADRERKPYRDLLPWSGEFAGKYLTGATQVLQMTGDERLREKLEEFVPEFLKFQDPDGYLGPFSTDHRLTGSAPNVGGKQGQTWDSWGHYHVMIGLILWHDTTGDPTALAAARRIGDLFCARFLGDKQPRLVDTGSTEMNLAPAHALCLLYRKTNERRYLDLARQLVDEFEAVDTKGQPLAGDYFRRGLAGEEFHRLPKPRWESLHPVLALAELARITGDDRYRKAYSNLWWSIVRLDRHNNGGFSSGEQAQGNPYHQGAIETCCTIAWMAMSVEMLRLSGDPVVADELELSLLNSGLGLFSPSGRWSTYNTPMDGTRKANYHDIVFQSRPGSPELNCCSVNAARGLGLLSDWVLMTDAKAEGLTLNWYGPGTLTGRLSSGISVRLALETDYPRSGPVRIRVEPDRPSRFPIRLRIPHWSGKTRVSINGEPVTHVKPATYLKLDREWKPGDTIALDLDLETHVWVGEKESAGRVSLYRGPILMTYDPRFNAEAEDDPAPLEINALALSTTTWAGREPPFLLVETKNRDGRPLRLCDFASAGFDGSAYRSWLRAEHAMSTPFSREHPWRSSIGKVQVNSRERH